MLFFILIDIYFAYKYSMKIIFMTVLILGSFFGAGFVSGREIASYFSVFGKYSWIGVIIATLLIFGLLYLFFVLSRKTNNFKDFVDMYFGKTGVVINWLFGLCLFILTSSMFAGSLVIAKTINFNEILFSIITAGACYFVVAGNLKFLEKINLILVPIIIVVMLCVCGINFFPKVYNGDIILSIISSSAYVFMNIVTLGLLILETGSRYTKKQALITCAISSIIIGILLFVCNNAIIKFDITQVPMPMLTLATKKGFGVWVVTAITIWIGLFTTIISCVFVLANYLNCYIKNYKLTIVVILILTLVSSLIGFEFLVGYIYWLIGFVGIFVVISVLIKEKKSQNRF